MRAWTVAVALILAGCASSAGTSDTTGLDAQLSGVEAEAGNGLGCLRGVVVDEAIRPIANVTILIIPGNRTVKADDRGVFTACELPPGTYFLRPSREGYTTVQSSADVVGDQVTNVRLGMVIDLRPRPFHETIKFEGFIQASASIGSFAVDLVAGEFLNTSTCKCTLEFYAAPTVVAITQEAVWTDSLPRAQPSTKYRELYPTNDVTLDSIKAAFEGSPMLVTFNRTAAWPQGDDGEFTSRITGDGYWVDYEQRYTMYITLWHNAQPPEGWSFVAGST